MSRHIPLFSHFFLLLISDRLESGCLRPLAPLNGEMFLLWSGLLIQFRCKGPQFRLIGPAAVICRNRTWTQDPPVCQLIQGKKKTALGAIGRVHPSPIILLVIKLSLGKERVFLLRDTINFDYWEQSEMGLALHSIASYSFDKWQNMNRAEVEITRRISLKFDIIFLLCALIVKKKKVRRQFRTVEFERPLTGSTMDRPADGIT